MGVIVILILASLLVASGFLLAFIWAVRSGQFEDTTMRVLTEDVRGGSADTRRQNHKPLPSA